MISPIGRTPSTDECLTLLRRILVNWPNTWDEAASTRGERSACFLTDNFDEVDFANNVNSIVEVIAITESDTTIVIVFVGDDGCAHRAVFRTDCDGLWHLESLKFQCPACFGTGDNNGTLCKMCGGVGWGAE